MTRSILIIGGLAWLLLGSVGPSQDHPAKPPAKPDASKVKSSEPIDFARARELLKKRQSGEKLTADEEAYLRRAIEAKRGKTAKLEGRDRTGLKPLSDMTAEDRYKGEDGGLYGEGRNTPPGSHRKLAEAELARIEPLDAKGKSAADGRIVLVSISMSNATQEFSMFKRIADADAAKSPHVTIVDCAQGGQAMAEWASPKAEPWNNAERIIAKSGCTPQQVQAAWIKLANKVPRGDLKEHGEKLKRDTLAVIQNAKTRFPNLRVVYLASRIYAGYATTNLNPEPYAYESAYVVRWLIQDQMKGEPELNFRADKGDVKAPVLLWGPYLWADGVTPRQTDKLVWTRDDLAGDGTHPSQSGREKVARLLLEFFKGDPLAKGWFVKK
jgi:hypothetical protein